MINIIVPIFNVEKVLHHCIDSILNQTYHDFELILVNDGSTDGSGDVCNMYAKKDKRIKVIHKNNSGVSAARNIGIENAQGDYICFIDSDDYISPTFLESLLEMQSKYPSYDNVWCCFHTVNHYYGDVVKSNCIDTEQKYVTFDISQIMTLHENWLDAGPVCKLYSRRIIEEYSLRFKEDLSLGEDLLFNFDYLDKTNGKIVVLNCALYFYVQINEESLSSKYYPNLFEIYKYLNNNLWQYITKWNCDEKQKQIFYNFCFFSYEKVLRNTYHSCSTEKRKQKYNRGILKSTEFSKSLSKTNCYIHPLYRFAYQHHSYGFVRLLDRIRSKMKASSI